MRVLITEIIIPIILIILIAYFIFNIDGHKPSSREIAPKLQLNNPLTIISGQCMQTSDCIYPSLVCLGNTCVVGPDAPIEQQCNEDHKCYNALVGISSLGVITNSCIPLASQHWDRDNCNTANPYNCLGEYSQGKCIPQGTGVAVSYTSYGGTSKLLVTLPSIDVANLFVNGNPGVLSIDNVVG